MYIRTQCASAVGVSDLNKNTESFIIHSLSMENKSIIVLVSDIFFYIQNEKNIGDNNIELLIENEPYLGTSTFIKRLHDINMAFKDILKVSGSSEFLEAMKVNDSGVFLTKDQISILNKHNELQNNLYEKKSYLNAKDFLKSTNFIMNFFIFMAVLISIFYLYVMTVFFVDYKIRSASFIKKISS